MTRMTRQNALNLAAFAKSEGQRKSRRTRKVAAPGSGRKQRKTQRGLPPVLVRNEAVASQAASNRRVKNRRRYDVALSVPGAEVRLPALPELHFSWRILSGLIALALIAGLYYAWTTPTFQIESLQVTGIERLTVSDFETVLGIEGELVFLLNPKELAGQLQAAFPELSSASVRVGLPAEVIIEVSERQPVLSWSRDGEELWLDSDGYVFPPRGEVPLMASVEGALPAVTPQDDDQEGRLVLDPAMVAAILKMSDHVPEGTRLAYEPDYGLGWTDWRGWQVYFGLEATDVDTKLVVYDALVERLDEQGVQPVLISMEFIHAPYYRVER
jgi:cell division protein FtsQ